MYRVFENQPIYDAAQIPQWHLYDQAMQNALKRDIHQQALKQKDRAEKSKANKSSLEGLSAGATIHPHGQKQIDEQYNYLLNRFSDPNYQVTNRDIIDQKLHEQNIEGWKKADEMYKALGGQIEQNKESGFDQEAANKARQEILAKQHESPQAAIQEYADYANRLNGTDFFNIGLHRNNQMEALRKASPSSEQTITTRDANGIEKTLKVTQSAPIMVEGEKIKGTNGQEVQLLRPAKSIDEVMPKVEGFFRDNPKYEAKAKQSVKPEEINAFVQEANANPPLDANGNKIIYDAKKDEDIIRGAIAKRKEAKEYLDQNMKMANADYVKRAPLPKSGQSNAVKTIGDKNGAIMTHKRIKNGKIEEVNVVVPGRTIFEKPIKTALTNVNAIDTETNRPIKLTAVHTDGNIGDVYATIGKTDAEGVFAPISVPKGERYSNQLDYLNKDVTPETIEADAKEYIRTNGKSGLLQVKPVANVEATIKADNEYSNMDAEQKEKLLKWQRQYKEKGTSAFTPSAQEQIELTPEQILQKKKDNEAEFYRLENLSKTDKKKSYAIEASQLGGLAGKYGNNFTDNTIFNTFTKDSQENIRKLKAKADEINSRIIAKANELKSKQPEKDYTKMSIPSGYDEIVKAGDGKHYYVTKDRKKFKVID
jgi:hypothetical protein